jgi:hypothetical protein
MQYLLSDIKEGTQRLLGKRVLRRVFGLKRDEVTRGWGKLYNEELHNLYSSPSILRFIKSRRMRWVGHVGRMGEEMNACRTCWESRRKESTRKANT